MASDEFAACPICAEPLDDEPTVERDGSTYHAHCWSRERRADYGL